jgi:peptidoglycan/LPS O-acetylase OafA/YrhL
MVTNRVPATISAGLSQYLDLLRLVAALTVFAWHLAEASSGSPVMRAVYGSWVGPEAVIVFFVISGLVIGHVGDRPDLTFRGFLFDRWTRLASVAIPAVLFTLATVTLLAPHLLPETGALLIQIAAVASFSTEWMGLGLRLPLFTPFWSVSLEAGFYLLFACWTFLTGQRRWAAVAIVGGLVGPAVLFAFPIWGLGVLAWSVIARGGPPRSAALPMALAPIGVYLIAKWLGWDRVLLDFGLLLIGPELGDRLGPMKYWAWYGPIGVLVAIHVVGMAGLLEGRTLPAGKGIAWGAGATYTLYLFHMPLNAILMSHFGFEWWATLAIVPAICLFLAWPFERSLKVQRTALRSLLSAIAGRRSRSMG